eukprot:gene3748-27995_t
MRDKQINDKFKTARKGPKAHAIALRQVKDAKKQLVRFHQWARTEQYYKWG